jgi:hypothetical protein
MSQRSGRGIVVAMVRALARTRPATGRRASVASSLAATKTANTASSADERSASSVAVANSAPVSDNIATPMAPTTRVTVKRHWPTSVRRLVNERRLARNGTRSRAAITVV